MEMKQSKTSKTNRWAVAKNFSMIFLPLSALIVGISILIHDAQVREERTAIEIREQYTVNLAGKAITHAFDSIVSDLIILSKNQSLREFLLCIPV